MSEIDTKEIYRRTLDHNQVMKKIKTHVNTNANDTLSENVFHEDKKRREEQYHVEKRYFLKHIILFYVLEILLCASHNLKSYI